jgi:peptidoglycan/xylan/chitin deacetylase (PgdA/CDA1 family)
MGITQFAETAAFPLGKRARLADVLDRVGLWRFVLEARARAVLPWRRLTVLTFHRVARPGAPGFDGDVSDTTPEDFDRQVAILKRYFTLVDVRALDAYRLGIPLPPNPAIISFDDGYRDNHDEALPILRRHGAKAVFFVATSFVGERRLFWWERVSRALGRARAERMTLRYPEPLTLELGTEEERRAATGRVLEILKSRPGLEVERFLADLESAAGAPLGRDEERALTDALVMTWDHVRALQAAGMDVQSHSRSHRILQTMTNEEVTADLRAAREELEEQIEAPVFAVAYPAGKPIDSPGLRRAVRRAGYRLGLTSSPGAARLDGDMDWLGIPRVTVERGMPDPFFRGCLAVPALAY